MDSVWLHGASYLEVTTGSANYLLLSRPGQQGGLTASHLTRASGGRSRSRQTPCLVSGKRERSHPLLPTPRGNAAAEGYRHKAKRHSNKPVPPRGPPLCGHPRGRPSPRGVAARAPGAPGHSLGSGRPPAFPPRGPTRPDPQPALTAAAWHCEQACVLPARRGGKAGSRGRSACADMRGRAMAAPVGPPPGPPRCDMAAARWGCCCFPPASALTR